MPGPINYGAYLTQLDLSPIAQAGQLIQQRRQFQAENAIAQQQIDLKREAAQREVAGEEAWGRAVQTALTDPTTANFNALYAFPDKVAAAKELHGQYTEGQQKRNLTAATEVGGLINAGGYSEALNRLKQRRAGLAESGESTEITDGLISALEDGSPAAIARARGLAGVYITMATGDPEKSGPLLDRLGYSATYDLDRRKQEETERHNRVVEGQGDARVAQGEARVGLSRAAGARAAAKAAGRGGGGGGGYEYRIGPDGKLQRRKR